VYTNQNNSPFPLLDYFYRSRKPWAIRGEYSVKTGNRFLRGQSEGVRSAVLLEEYQFYHKIGNKKRLKEIVPSGETV
jgi:hypothetical protein